MCTVLMHVDDVLALAVGISHRYGFTIHITAQVWALVNHQASLASLTCLIGYGSSEEAGADN